MLRKSGGAAARHTAKHAVKQATSKASRQAYNVVSKARVTQAMRHFSDDAARAGGRVATPAYADDLAKVANSVTAQNHRRLMMLAPELKQSGKAGLVIQHMAKSNKADGAVEFLWRHRGKLAAGTAAATVAVHADDLARAGGEFVAKPIIEGSMEHVAKPVVSTLIWVIPVCGVVATGAFMLRRRQAAHA